MLADPNSCKPGLRRRPYDYKTLWVVKVIAILIGALAMKQLARAILGHQYGLQRREKD